MRRVPLLSICAVFLAFAVSARAAEPDPALVAAAKKEGRATFYTPLIVDQLARPLTAAFKAKYGIQVDFQRMDSDAVILKILNEYRAKRAVADVYTTSLNVGALIKSGAAKKFSLPDSDQFAPGYKDPNGYWAADRLYVLVAAVNTTKVAPADRPKTYDDLLSPKWTGKFAWRLNNLTGSTGFIGSILTGMGDEKGMAYLKKLAAQKPIALNLSDRAVLDQVIAGEFPMTIAMTNHNVEISRKEGAPLAWIPLEPAMVFSEQIGVTSLGPHPNAGLLFLQYALSREGQEVFRKAGYIPARKDVPPLDPKLLPESGGFKASIGTPELVEKNVNHWDAVYRQLFR
jgi:ABC-type Fe3+ transport system substrate-binding protein